ncbi:hypothetical protein C7974DRAFT_446596, partial [Boeremia exigua]|uniref:uncharacterized protein n=1 Tax=Boeremia exigua TaxID=749465 RepID=UPI001E8ED1EF
HNDYYCYGYGQDSNVLYEWAKNSSNYFIGATASANTTAAPADPVPDELRHRKPNFIAGAPSQGWYEQLDSSYRMRTGAEARAFFRLGRVFSMLFVEAADAIAQYQPENDALTEVRFGGHVYTQVRRFVVVSVRRNFVQACAISTYRNQGTLRRGCDPTEHALVYNSSIDPESCYLPGECERGLTKEPIEVIAADASAYLTRTSRIRFGKIYSIEWNVKVKDIGFVTDGCLGTLTEHYKYEDQRWDTAD